jgi:hypothetical protein
VVGLVERNQPGQWVETCWEEGAESATEEGIHLWLVVGVGAGRSQMKAEGDGRI